MTFPLFRLRRRPSVFAMVDRNQADRPSQTFQFPLRFAGRLALLGGGFRAERNARVFPTADLPSLQDYQPEALALPLDLALTLADRKLRGHFELPSLQVAIVVLTQLEDSPLAEHHRDLLWRAFNVPVFEQLRAPDGIVIARECEVHDGLHLVESAVPRPAIDLITEHCECGSEVPRLRHRTHVPVAAAASA